MKLLSVLLWLAFIFVCTCTSNPNKLIEHIYVSFNLVMNPDFMELLIDDISLRSTVWLTHKAGHFIGFTILYVLILNWLRSTKSSLAISILLAVLSEIIQLYFARDGRISDMIIDSSGILLAWYIFKYRFQKNLAPTS